MNDSQIGDRSLRVLDLLSNTPQLSQRELAQSTGVSLGLINLTLKRLIQTGYLKISNLNSRKVEYILTSKGLKEKSKRTYSYISKTVNTFMQYRTRLDQFVQDLLKGDNRHFAILGEGEIATLLEMSLRNSGNQINFRYLKSGQTPAPHETILDCRFKTVDGGVGISILSQLLENQKMSAAK